MSDNVVIPVKKDNVLICIYLQDLNKMISVNIQVISTMPNKIIFRTKCQPGFLADEHI